MKQPNYVRPMRTGQLFSAVFLLYRRYFGVFFSLNLVGMAGLTVYNLTIVQNLPRSFGIFDVVYLFFFTICTVIVNATTLVAASNAALGRPVSLLGAFRRAFTPAVVRKLGFYSLFSVVLLAGLLAPGVSLVNRVSMNMAPEEALAVVALLLPVSIGTLIALTLVAITEMLIAPICVLEKRGIWSSLVRSMTLFFRNAGRIILNYGIVWSLPLNLVFWGISLLSNELQVRFLPEISSLNQIATLSLLLTSLAGAFLYPISNLLTTLLYYDTRARIEAYSEVVLAQEMGYEPLAEMIIV